MWRVYIKPKAVPNKWMEDDDDDDDVFIRC